MPQAEFNTDAMGRSSAPFPSAADMASAGKQRFDTFVDMQSEIINQIQQVNRTWLDRVQSEADLAAELAAKLKEARTIPETATAFQEWTSRRMQLAADDAKHIWADVQKVMETSARAMSSGLTPGSS